MIYKTSSAGSIRQWSGSAYYSLANLVADGQWHGVTFWSRSDIMHNYAARGPINILFEITSTTCYCDGIRSPVDTDGDALSNPAESLRLHLYDPATYYGDKSKTFSTSLSGPVTMSFAISLRGERVWDGGWVIFPTSGHVYLDGTLIWSGQSSGYQSYTVFSPSIVRTLSAGTHTLFIDIDGANDGNTKHIKFVNSYDLDVFSNDTDSDGLQDFAELAGGTGPCDPDCDDDGLADGSELYSQVWTTDNFLTIPDNGDDITRAVIKFTLPALSAPLTAVWLQVGILHSVTSQLKVKVQRGTGTIKTLHNLAADVNLFKSWDLFTQGYTLSDFTSSATWTIYVEDYTSGTIGRVEYAICRRTGRRMRSMPIRTTTVFSTARRSSSAWTAGAPIRGRPTRTGMASAIRTRSMP
jgi:hypothetical protein